MNIEVEFVREGIWRIGRRHYVVAPQTPMDGWLVLGPHGSTTHKERLMAFGAALADELDEIA